MKNRRWIWFFVILVALSLVAMTSLIAYNLNQQLTPDKLEAARQLWREKGLRSYQLTYTIKRGIESNVDTYVVRVRHGHVVSSSVNEQAEPPQRFVFRGMDALFDYIARFQELDSKPGHPRTFTVAEFDENTGALIKYIRRVMGGQERAEIRVDSLEPLGGS